MASAEVALQLAPEQTLKISDFYRPWPHQEAFHLMTARHRLAVGGFGCVAAGTIIANGIAVENWSGGIVGQRFAGPSFLKGVAKLYRVSTRSGRQVVVTDAHRFLSPTGWCPLSGLSVGDLIASDGSEHEVSAKGKSADSRGRCFEGLHRQGELFPPFQAAFLHKLQQFRRTGVCSNARSFYTHLSIENSYARDLFLGAFFSGNPHELVADGWPRRDQESLRLGMISELHSVPRRPSGNVQRFLQEEDDAFSSPGSCVGAPHWNAFVLNSVDDPRQISVSSLSLPGSKDDFCGDEAFQYERNLSEDFSLAVPGEYLQTFWDEIVEIVYTGKGDFYDLTVPGLEHYSAQGLWHHNSGKSRPLLMEAILQCLDHPGISAIIMRKTIPDLKRTVIDKFESDVPKALYERGIQARGTYNKTDHIVYFPPQQVDDYDIETGEFVIDAETRLRKKVWRQSKLYFAACERLEDVGKYLSTEFAFIGFEELGEFSYGIYDAMEGRNRCTIPGVRPCMAGVTNPMGIGWGWIKKLWIDKKPMYGMDPDKYKPDDYQFIHSTVDNNPILKRDQAYLDSLEKSPLRDKIRWGDIETVSGQYFENFEETRHVLPASAFIFESWQPVWIGWDYGFGHFAAMTFWTKAILKPRFEREKPRVVNVTVGEIWMKGKTVEEQCAAIISFIPRSVDEEGHDQGMLWNIDSIHFSWERFIPSMKTKEGDVISIADQAGTILVAAGLPRPTRSSTDRVAGWVKMYSMLDQDEWFLLKGKTTQCAEALPLLVRGNGLTCSMEDVVKPKEASLSDDIGDGLRYACAGVLLDPADKPREQALREKLAGITDPMRRHVVAYKEWNEHQAKQNKPSSGKIIPSWMNRVKG